MIIAGAGGHALEVFNECCWLGIEDDLMFFDETIARDGSFYGKPVLHSREQAYAAIQSDPRFIIGVGTPMLRKYFYEYFTALGGRAYDLISKYARVGKHSVSFGEGINLMAGAGLTIDVSVGKGSLIHMNSTLHHHSVLGDFCEISPGAHILGKVKIGNYVSVGTGSIILPGVHIGDGAVIGAGAVVTKNVEAGRTVVGVPAVDIGK